MTDGFLGALYDRISSSGFWAVCAGPDAAGRAAEYALWIAAAVFMAILAFYRTRPRLYGLAAGFLALSSSAWFLAIPLEDLSGGILPAASIGLALRIAANLSLAGYALALGERPATKASRLGMGLLGALGLAAVTAGVVSARVRPWTSLVAVLAQLGLAMATVVLLAGRSKDQAPVRRLLPPAVLWLLGLIARLVPVNAAAPYLMAASAASETLFALSVILSSMMELAKHSHEETVLDERALKLSQSVKRFIPAEFLAYLQKQDVTDLNLGDHVKKEMTIFFSDIRAFTELAESLTPEESFAFVNSYLSRVVPVITAHRGFVDKYMGDAIMALFSEDTGADDAIESAVEMQRKMQEYNGHRAKVGYRSVSMGVGIHTGPLMMGVVGVGDRMEGTVISDSVNLASRLQSIAKAFNIPLVISERTFMSLSDPGKYKYRFIGKVRVKGKDAPVSVFEIFDGLADELFERKMRSNTFFEQGMMAYYQKDFSSGIFYFQRALEHVPEDGASRFYLETCIRKAMAGKKAEAAGA